MKTIKQYSLKADKTDFPKVQICRSADAADFIRQFYSDDIEIYESCFILLLNRQNVTVGYAKISQGGIAGTVVDIKIVCKYVVDSLCSNVIIAHNHPSGVLKPSEADIKLTNNLRQALSYLDSRLCDHIIMTADSYVSLADEGLM